MDMPPQDRNRALVFLIHLILNCIYINMYKIFIYVSSLHKDVPFELRESYDICGNLRYFPDTIRPKFGSAMNALEEASKPLIKSLLRVLAISLKLEDTDFFVERTKALDDLDIPSYTTIRSLYYPPTWNKNISPGTVR